MRNYFTAKYKSYCYKCGTPILPGDTAFFASDRDSCFGVDCCAQYTDEELLPIRSLAIDLDEELSVHPQSVMPRRKTARDMCNNCFQIPASNGVCGCVG